MTTTRKHRTTPLSIVLLLAACWPGMPRLAARSSVPLMCLCEAYSTNTARARVNAKGLPPSKPAATSSASISGECGGDVGDRRAFLARSTAFATACQFAPLLLSPREASAAESVPASLVGKRAPDFALPNTRGDLITLDSLVAASSSSSDGGRNSAKWTVLYFYPGAFTSGCTLEARKFQEDIESYRTLGARVVGVSVDPVEKNSEFCQSEGLDFYMLSDVAGKVSKAYGSAISIPGFGTFSNRQTYLIDSEGKLRWVFTDVESRIPRHSGEVLDKLKELKG